jgi:hypothetical protein
MPDVPQPLVRGDQSIHRAAAVKFDLMRPTREHGFENIEQLHGHQSVLLITCLMKSKKELVRKSSIVPGRPPSAIKWRRFPEIFQDVLPKPA